MMLSAVLFGYAALVATLAPKALARSWALRPPRLSVALWHAAAASVVIAVVVAGIACTTSPGMIQACFAAILGHTGAAGILTVAAALIAPGMLVARLTAVAATDMRKRRAERSRHIELLSVLGRHDTRLGVTVIPGRTPAAYCVPGTDRVVLTGATLDVLDRAELQAILAHEHAHLAGRHHLLVAWAGVLARAFPGVPIFRSLLPATTDLVELLADDHAVRRAGRVGLVGAIAAFAGSTAAIAGLAASGGQVLVRLERLLDPPRELPLTARVAGTGVATALLAAPTLMILASVLIAGLAACPFFLG